MSQPVSISRLISTGEAVHRLIVTGGKISKASERDYLSEGQAGLIRMAKLIQKHADVRELVISKLDSMEVENEHS